MSDSKRWWTFLIVIFFLCTVSCNKVLFAVNLGGNAHEDSNGIMYQKDIWSHSRKHIRAQVFGASDKDQIIYQRSFNGEELNIDLPIDGNGDYTLILKLVVDQYHKTIDVFINNKHKVMENLNITTKVERNAAYDKTLKFAVFEDQLTWKNEKSDIVKNKIKFQLLQTPKHYDCVSVGAIVWKKEEMIDLNQKIMNSLNDIKTSLLQISDEFKKITQIVEATN
jgi:hypothetical protein